MVIQYIILAAIFLALDSVWLTSTSKLYRGKLGPLLRPRPNFIAAGLFYVIYIAGLWYFALQPVTSGHTALQAARDAGLFGFACYATYDLTNAAVLKQWPWSLTILDLCWGSLASAVATFITYLVAS
jgi:uncharacterized membrane protein